MSQNAPSACPTCGSLCEVVSGDEGTSHFEPIWNPIRDERDRYREALTEIVALPRPQLQTRTWREIAQDALESPPVPTVGADPDRTGSGDRG